MAISPVKKFNLVSLTSHKQEIIELLHDFGIAEIANWENNEEIIRTDERSPEYLHAQVTFAINFLRRFDETKVSLKEKLLSGKPEFTKNELEKLVTEFDYMAIVKKCEEAEARLNKLNNLVEKNKSDRGLLETWKGIEFVPKAEIETEKTYTLLGSSTFEAWQKIMVKAEKMKNVNLQKSHELDREIFFIITFYKTIEKKVRELLTHYDFKPAQLPEINCLPADKYNDCEEDIKSAEKEIIKVTEDIKKLTSNLHKLNIVFEYLSWKKEQKEALDKSIKTEKTFALLFWMEEMFVDKFKKAVSKITKNFELEEIPVKEGESAPIVLRNKNIIEPFESVTGIYGMPLKSEVDPTPFLAPFFFVFFGFCVSDAGYGILMTLIMLLVLKLSKKPKEDMKLVRLLALGGISTLIAGALFGSWFGLDLANMADGSWLKSFILFFKVIDPVRDPITVLIIAFIFGLVQIMTGLAINTWWKIKQGQKSEGLLGSGLWFLMLFTFILWVLAKVGVLIPSSAGNIITYILLGMAGALVLANGRKTKNIFLKIPIGLYSLYDVIGYLSDTLSYSRLLALGLATGIIAMVINLIAGLAIDMIPIVGYVFAIFILIGGHVFNIAINALGAFIHSGRLQFVEFFPKFMEGGGTRFKAFKKVPKYIIIKPNKN